MIAGKTQTIRRSIERRLQKLMEAAIAMQTEIAALLDKRSTEQSLGRE